MHFGLFITGLAFLCNPLISTLDFLPDSIGWCLIYASLLRISFVSDRLTRARRSAGMAAVVCLPRIYFSISYWCGSEAFPMFGDRVMALTLAVLYAVVETCLFVSFIRSLMDGLTDIATVLSSAKGMQLYEKRQRRAIRFIMWRGLFSLLPEVIYLGNFSFLEYDINGIYMDIRAFHPLLAGISAGSMLCISIPFFVSFCRFLRVLRRDASLVRGLDALYCGKAEQIYREKLLYRCMISFGLFFAAFVPLMPFSADGIRFLPRVLLPIILFFSMRVFPNKCPLSRSIRFLLCCSGAVSLLEGCFSLWYYSTVYEKWANSWKTAVQFTDERIWQQGLQFVLFGLTCLEVLCFLTLGVAAFRYLAYAVRVPLYAEQSIYAVMQDLRVGVYDQRRALRRPRFAFLFFALILLCTALAELPAFSFYTTPLQLFYLACGSIFLLFLYLWLADLSGAAKRLLRR